MSDAVLSLNADNFEETIGTGVTLVDFWAPWCGPCKMQLPIVEAVAAKATEAKIAKVNVDECPELAVKFSVRSIPTLILFKDGENKKQFIGLQQEAALIEAIASVQ